MRLLRSRIRLRLFQTGLKITRTLAVATLLAGMPGCGSDPFQPPPPAELSDTSSSQAALTTPDAPTLEVLLQGTESPERSLWEGSARQEAGRRKAILRINRFTPGSAAAAQAEQIRQRVAERKPAVLIVEALDDPAVATALNDVRAAGTFVVVLDRKIASRDPAAPLASVSRTSYDEPARQLATYLVRDARENAIKVDRALIPVNLESDPGREQLVAALTRALLAAGVADVVTIPFKGEFTVAKQALLDRIKADPRVTLLVAHENRGVTASIEVIQSLTKERQLSMAGFSEVERNNSAASFGQCAAVVDNGLIPLINKAVQVGVHLTRGEATPLDIVIPFPVYPHEGPRNGGIEIHPPEPVEPGKSHSGA